MFTNCFPVKDAIGTHASCPMASNREGGTYSHGLWWQDKGKPPSLPQLGSQQEVLLPWPRRNRPACSSKNPIPSCRPESERQVNALGACRNGWNEITPGATARVGMLPSLDMTSRCGVPGLRKSPQASLSCKLRNAQENYYKLLQLVP